MRYMLVPFLVGREARSVGTLEVCVLLVRGLQDAARIVVCASESISGLFIVVN